MRLFIIFISMVFLASSFAHATEISLNANDKDPLEISADTTLEWHRKDQKYIATGDAKAKQGEVTIQADKLTANYHETEETGIDIYKLFANKNVIISSSDSQVYGESGVYEVETGLATLTGNNLKMITPEQTVLAEDLFEYDVKKGIFKALGNAKVTRGEDIIQATSMVAFLKEDKLGKRHIERLEAYGNVVITTPNEILNGDKAIYSSKTNIAQVLGNVIIKRGQNILEGAKAEINLNNDVSKMFAAPGKRVEGTFYPETRKEK